MDERRTPKFDNKVAPENEVIDYSQLSEAELNDAMRFHSSEFADDVRAYDNLAHWTLEVDEGLRRTGSILRKKRFANIVKQLKTLQLIEAELAKKAANEKQLD